MDACWVCEMVVSLGLSSSTLVHEGWIGIRLERDVKQVEASLRSRTPSR